MTLNKELHDAIYLSPVLPHDLLQNLSDPAYLDVRFESHLDGLMATLVFIDEGEQVEAIYYFNQNQILQRVEMIEGECVSILYDRMEAIIDLLKKSGDLSNLEEIKRLMAA
jgi:hypothetical protein